jgi:hypothetical protein
MAKIGKEGSCMVTKLSRDYTPHVSEGILYFILFNFILFYFVPIQFIIILFAFKKRQIALLKNEYHESHNYSFLRDS